MRTTVSIDDDLALRLEHERLAEHKTFKEYLNQVIRAGLAAGARSRVPTERFRTESASLGGRLVGEAHSVSELLAVADGDGYR
jgi:hypothetical protein